MSTLAPLNLHAWIEEHRHLLKPPVGNACIWNSNFLVMVVGGPNARNDYHINPGEELFYQVEGDIVLKIIEDGTPREVPIRQGELFLLPAGVPHSPQRSAGTVGLGDEVEIVCRGRSKSGFQRTQARIRDGTGRQTHIFVRVVRVRAIEVGAVDFARLIRPPGRAHPSVEAE